jgi:hypothetical protein
VKIYFLACNDICVSQLDSSTLSSLAFGIRGNLFAIYAFIEGISKLQFQYSITITWQ